MYDSHFFNKKLYDDKKRVKNVYSNFYDVFPTYKDLLREALSVTLWDIWNYPRQPDNIYERVITKLTDDELFQLLTLLEKLGYTSSEEMEEVYPKLKRNLSKNVTESFNDEVLKKKEAYQMAEEFIPRNRIIKSVEELADIVNDGDITPDLQKLWDNCKTILWINDDGCIMDDRTSTGLYLNESLYKSDEKVEALKKVLVKDFGYTKEEAERNAMDLYGEDYVVYTEKEANAALLKKISEMIDEMGLSAFPDRYQKIILKDYVINDDAFRDLYAEDVISYFNNLSEEEQKKELEKYNAESVIDYTVYRSEDEVDTDTYAEYMYNIYGGDEYFDNILLIDKEGFVDYIATDPDNRGIFLSTDGEEHTMDGFVIFKKVD